LPCSAEWRINFWVEKTYWFWSEDNIKKNYKLQKEILSSILPILKTGWNLVYSTCTIAPEENEGIVHFLLSNFKNLEIQEIFLDYKNIRNWIASFWNTVYNKNVIKSLRCLPSEETEGFFIAKFKKI
jgi:16S rRNA C967 or C1407 C5-methylase (RsmB/RsmF family)